MADAPIMNQEIAQKIKENRSNPRRTSLLKSSECQVHLITVGNSAVGKTSLLLKWSIEDFRKMNQLILTKSTIGIDYFLTPKLMTAPVGSGNSRTYQMLVQSWDTAGQEQFRSNMKPYFRSRHGCLFVFSVDDATSFQNLELWMQDMRDVNPKLLSTSAPRSVIVANKADIAEDKWAVTREEAEAYGKKKHMKVFFTSTASGDGVCEAFDHLCDLVAPDAKPIPKAPKPRNSGGCC